MIELAYFGGFSHSEIAEMLGAPSAPIKGRMRLGLEKIRATLAEGFPEGTRQGHICERPVRTAGRHDELRDDLAAYALGALEEDEAERLRPHLETCEDCRRPAALAAAGGRAPAAHGRAARRRRRGCASR